MMQASKVKNAEADFYEPVKISVGAASVKVALGRGQQYTPPLYES
jgi:hypothetical protein